METKFQAAQVAGSAMRGPDIAEQAQAASQALPKLHLVSHHLCPYVQRVAIVLREKGVPFERSYIDLADKPAWFLKLSPLGKVPLLRVATETLFESAVICEYLDETVGRRLHPADPLRRAKHRAWMEFGSALLNGIAGFYNAADGATLEAKRRSMQAQCEAIERVLGDGPYFDGTDFSMVDAVFGPALRYFDVFDEIADFRVLQDTPKVRAWRSALAARPSVASAVLPDYRVRLADFLRRRDSALSGMMAARET